MPDAARSTTPAPSTAALDLLLTAQIAVAWAGEGHVGEEPRLGWWRSDLTSEFGGRDLFERLLPRTFRWASFQAVREAARRADAELRERAHNPDGVTSLYSLGFDLDELAEERLLTLKRGDLPPEDALPNLRAVLTDPWDPAAFTAFLQAHGKADYKVEPLGRHLVGAQPLALEDLVHRLLAALAPLAPAYPLPHYRAAK
jgi:hypothetical protein